MKTRNFVNMNMNPCKMCMPMGGVMALKGIENSMVILHGSQGCSTYIRRHMATHYNEPIDIASSSLTEQGTVYGGAENLKKGIKNIVKLYNPEIIGVLTTCLAETIGEDIERIIAEFYEETANNEEFNNLKIVTIPSPGYGGTQAEGYYKTLRRLVEEFSEVSEPNKKINIISSNLNPGDVRNIKEILDDFGVDYIMLPDVSETLDAEHLKKYNRIPEGGTKFEDIRKMAGSIATVEMGVTIEEKYSPGKYLENKYSVPLYKCATPIGIKNTDEFLNIISKITGLSIPEKYKKQRGRYLDAMIDSHKYNGEARAVIYGEPELIAAITDICLENGIKPVLIATGSKNKILKDFLDNKVKNLFEKPLILDDTDFETIENYTNELNANIMIGNSDGRRIEEKLGIHLLRIGFPIHDRIGAQRQVFTGYVGSLNLIDGVANSVIENNEKSFRKTAYDKYFNKSVVLEEINMAIEEDGVKTIEDKTKFHPCYSENAHEYARMHIPVAPKCNIKCNYCNRKYDCVNESRPGVTSEILKPEEALEKFKAVKEKISNMTVVGIAGPGDALANFEETKKSIELIKKESPDTTFCLSTNGLMLPFYANDIIELGVSHVTITINTLDPKVGAKIYREVNYLGTTLIGEAAANMLLNNQLSGLKYLTSKGVICKVNIVMIKGINDEGIPEVVKKVKELGAFMTNIMQLIPASGSKFENMPLVSNIELNEMRKKCQIDLKQMYHCKQCRADAIGKLSHDCSIDFRNMGCGSSSCGVKKDDNAAIAKSTAILNKKQEDKEYKFAISSKSGMNIDQHFGHAEEFYIYDYFHGEVKFVEKRNVSKYCEGVEECGDHDDKISKIIKTVEDCNAVLALRAGFEPIKKLESHGIKIFQMYDGINKGIEKAVKLIEAS